MGQRRRHRPAPPAALQGGVVDMRANPMGWPTAAWRSLLVFILAMGAIGIAGSLSNFVRLVSPLDDLGPPGASYAQPAGTPQGWLVAKDVWLDGPAARAGIREGDLVRFDQPFGNVLMNRADWPTPVTIDRGSTRLHSTIVVKGQPLDDGTRSLLVLFGAQALVSLAFGVMLVLRGRGNRPAALLGLILIPLGTSVVSLPVWTPTPAVAIGVQLIMLPINSIIGYLWPLFSLEISGGAASARQSRLVRIGALAFAAAFMVMAVLQVLHARIPVLGLPSMVSTLLIIANQVFGYGIIARNYRRNATAARNRIKIVTIAFVCFLIASVIIQTANVLLGSGSSPADLVPLRLGLTVMSFAGLALLAYGVRRQKLFDLNFALNRTLVYGVVSFILLAAFGLAEWVVEHLVPEEWHQGGPLFSAGIALALFLSFHRLRDWVEDHVERLVFRSWHLNEAALRRFVAASEHFDQPPALRRAFVEELSRFARGAAAALYVRTVDGRYTLQAGQAAGANAEYAEEDRLFALMRAERRPVNVAQAHSLLPGALALPMLDQASLAGFILLDPKPDKTEYRPDEIEALGWATQHVGFALQAQYVRELEGTIAELRARVALLGAPAKPGAHPPELLTPYTAAQSSKNAVTAVSTT
jgi:hypothetical protein